MKYFFKSQVIKMIYLQIHISLSFCQEHKLKLYSFLNYLMIVFQLEIVSVISFFLV